MKTFINKTFLAVVATVLVAGTAFFTSCNKEDDFNSTNGQYETKSLGTNISTRQIAQELAEAIKMNPEIATEIHSAIATVVDYGLDENITFYDILNTDKSVFLKSDANISNLRSAINVSTLQNLGLGSADNYYGNLNIYWGYHDEWDNTTIPTICYLDANHTSTNAKGFSIVNGNIEEVEITEEYFDSAVEPIILIGYNEIDYSKYPDFKNGIRTKAGRIWLKPSITPGTLVPWNPNPIDSVYEARVYGFRSSGTQYDFMGGSEFVLKFAYIDKNGIQQENESYFEVKRKHIRNNKFIYIDVPVHEDWKYKSGNVYVHLSEEDGGVSFSPIDIKLVYEGFEISTTMTINTDNDFIYKGSISRNNYFRECNVGNGEFLLGREKIYCTLDVYAPYN